MTTTYLPLAPGRSRYFYAQKGDFSEVIVASSNDKTAFAANLPAGLFPGEVSAEEARLSTLFRYPGLREHFASCGWATEFGNGPYILSPVLFQNIYKGALGESAGSYILKKEFGFDLQEVEDPACFELFDFIGPNNLWFGFKHWKSSTRQDLDIVRHKALNKQETAGGRRAFLINLISESDFSPTCTADERLVEVPGLLLPDGTINRRSLEYLARYL